MRQTEQISRRLKLRHLKVLLAVVEERSMLKAAQRLAVSQPVISKAIADLERLLDLPLLERGPRGIEPTVYGRALLKRSRSIFDDLRASISELESLADPRAGELKIGITEAMAAAIGPAIIERMSRRYPRIAFEVVLADPVTLLERELRGRRVDLILGRFPQDISDVTTTILSRDRLHIVTGSTSALARRRKITLADLVNERWVLPPPNHPINSFVANAFRRGGLQLPQSVVTVASATFTRALVASGQFLGVLGSAGFGLKDARSSIRILPNVLPLEVSAAWPVSILMLKNRALTPTAKLFIDCAREVASPLATVGRQGRT
jgi:DNA-binding transcriptional LysR family regulator